MVLQLPVNLIREALPTIDAKYAVKLALAQLMQLFTARQPRKIFIQLSGGALGLLGNNSDILYFRFRLGFVAYILNFIENIRLPEAFQPLRDRLVYRHGRTAGSRIADITGAKKAPLSTIMKAALHSAVMTYEKILRFAYISTVAWGWFALWSIRSSCLASASQTAPA